MNTAQQIVVIGCSGTGALAALALKKLRPELDVTLSGNLTKKAS